MLPKGSVWGVGLLDLCGLFARAEAKRGFIFVLHIFATMRMRAMLGGHCRTMQTDTRCHCSFFEALLEGQLSNAMGHL